MSYEGLKFNWEKCVPPVIITVTPVETHLPRAVLTPTEISLMSYYDELGRQAARLQVEGGKKNEG